MAVRTAILRSVADTADNMARLHVATNPVRFALLEVAAQGPFQSARAAGLVGADPASGNIRNHAEALVTEGLLKRLPEAPVSYEITAPGIAVLAAVRVALQTLVKDSSATEEVALLVLTDRESSERFGLGSLEEANLEAALQRRLQEGLEQISFRVIRVD